jgi:hypothetical protein
MEHPVVAALEPANPRLLAPPPAPARRQRGEEDDSNLSQDFVIAL